MKSKNKNKGCFNCIYAGTTINHASVFLGMKCSFTGKIHDPGYSCKKWTDEYVVKSITTDVFLNLNPHIRIG